MPTIIKNAGGGQTIIPTVPQQQQPVQPAPTPFTAPSAPVDVSALTSTAPITLPPAPTTSNYDISSLPSITSLLNPTPTAADNTQIDLQGKLLSDTQKLGTKTAAQTTAEDTAARGLGATNGLSDFNSQLTDVNNQIQTLQKENAAIPLQVQQDFAGRATSTLQNTFSTGQLRQNSIKALGLSAIAQTLQGNIASAQATASRAVDLEFAPVQADIDYLNQAISINKDTLDKEDKTRTAELQVELADRQTQLDQQKEDRNTVIAMAAAAMKNNPNDPAAQYAAQKALQAPDLATAFQLVGKYQADPVAAEQAIADLQYTRAQTAKLNQDTQAAGVPPITNPDAGQYSTALNIILGSSKFTKDQKTAVINAVNTGEDPFTVVKNQAKNIMGQTEATKLTSYEAADSAMQDIKKNLADFYASGGSTGLLKGTMEQTINSLGSVTDPALVGVATQVAVSLQSYRNAISGTAYSDQEGKDIASIFPGINKSQGLNTAVIDGRIKADQGIIDGIYKTALGSTYDDLKAANAPQSPSSSGDPYAQYRSQLEPGEILVLRNGQPYAIKSSEFNLKTDTLPAAGMNKLQ